MLRPTTRSSSVPQRASRACVIDTLHHRTDEIANRLNPITAPLLSGFMNAHPMIVGPLPTGTEPYDGRRRRERECPATDGRRQLSLSMLIVARHWPLGHASFPPLERRRRVGLASTRPRSHVRAHGCRVKFGVFGPLCDVHLHSCNRSRCWIAVVKSAPQPSLADTAPAAAACRTGHTVRSTEELHSGGGGLDAEHRRRGRYDDYEGAPLAPEVGLWDVGGCASPDTFTTKRVSDASEATQHEKET